MRLKNPFQFPHHWRVIRMPLQRRIRRGQQPSGRPLKIKPLHQSKGPLRATRRRKEFVNHRCSPLMAHLFIVGAVSQQQLLILSQESGTLRQPFIPDQDAPPARPQDPFKFRSRPLQIKPVRRLRSGHEINRGRAQRSFFRRPRHHHALLVPRQHLRTHRAHLRIRLHGKHTVPILQQQPRKNSRPRGHVRHHMLRP